MKSKVKSVAAPIGVAALLGGLLAACGGGSTTSSGPVHQKSTVAQLAPLAGIASCSAPQGTLNFVGDTAASYVDSFNPFSSTANTAAQFPFVYETLLQYSLSNSKTVIPWLASAYSWSNGGRTLTFNIRQGIHWSDGKPFSAADVAFTFNLLKKDPATNLKGITFSSVQQVGSSEIRMTFAQPAYNELYYIGTQYIVPQHIWSTIKNPTTALNTHPIGTGPYLLSQLSQQSMVLTANPNYWQKGVPCIYKVSAPPYDSNTTADLAMEQGGGDWGGLFVAGMSKYTAKPYHKYWNPPVADDSLYLNLRNPMFKSLALRKAISLSLNRSAIETAADLGELKPITNATGLVLPRDSYQLASAYKNSTFTYSVSQAKQVLSAAGYHLNGGTLSAPDGKAVKFTLDAPSAFSDWVSGEQTIANELKAIGIKVQLNAIPNTEWLTDLQKGNFQASFTTANLGPTSFFQYNGLFSPSTGQDYEGYSNPATTKLLNQYLDTNNPATQQKAMAGLEGVMVKQLPVIPIFYQTDWGLYSTQHITGWPSASNPYQISSSYDTPMNLVVLLHLKWK